MLKNKQFKYPKEFRIYPTRLHFEALEKLRELIQNIELATEEEAQKEINTELLATLSIGAWRLKKKMVDPNTKEPLKEMSTAYRHLESILNTLEKEKVEIKDHDNMIWDSGLSLKVLTFQPTPNIDKDTIIETIKPSIYYKDELLVLGEVIVGTPINKG